jgi:hypothetical protein
VTTVGLMRGAGVKRAPGRGQDAGGGNICGRETLPLDTRGAFA